jgi:hypothetical protein
MSKGLLTPDPLPLTVTSLYPLRHQRYETSFPCGRIDTFRQSPRDGGFCHLWR